MNYNEFNGLGLLGQSIQCIKETDKNVVLTKYEEFLESRTQMDKTFSELLQKKSLLSPNDTNLINTFLEYFLNNVNNNHYESIKTLEQRILTLDKAFHILIKEYNENYSVFLGKYENEDHYSEIIPNYLYIKSMNDFVERMIKLIEELPKIPQPKLQ